MFITLYQNKILNRIEFYNYQQTQSVLCKYNKNKNNKAMIYIDRDGRIKGRIKIES